MSEGEIVILPVTYDRRNRTVTVTRPFAPLPGSGALNRDPQVHALKTWPAFYEAVAGGRKPFEARKADRDFEVGDTLRLEEWSPTTREYTGRSCERLVTYIMRGPVFGVEAGWVVLGLALPNESSSATAGLKRHD